MRQRGKRYRLAITATIEFQHVRLRRKYRDSTITEQIHLSIVTIADTAPGIYPMMRLVTPALVLLIIPFSAQPECEQDSNVQTMFEQLTGDWHGEAVTTPVGPRPYDINFERRDSFWIYGQADPGAAVHHWGFYCEDGRLWLRFLSTFQGNREPILLEAESISDAELRFRAEHPAFLEVIVRPGNNHSQFEVLHHGKRHVLIELNRDNQG